jgi:Family of unknown function (DUF6314)
MKTARQIFDSLRGEWGISRVIESTIPQKNRYIAEGVAFFTLSKDNADTILYSEKLEMHNPSLNDSFSMTQKYQYKYDADTLSLYKYFIDERLFYKLKISGDKISGEHICIDDKYISDYVFDNDQLIISYIVSGPKKSYEIKTSYRKIS